MSMCYYDSLSKEVPIEELVSFIDKTKGIGATHWGIDISDYGFSSIPLCLYALKGRKLVGAISKSGTKLVDDYQSNFSMKYRKFVYLDE